MTETAEAVVQLATADPETALDLADELMRRPRISDRERVTLYRAMSLANRVLGRFEEAIDLASSARAKAAESGDDEQQLLAALTMVGPMMILGRSAEALDLIDSTAGLATTPYLESRVSFQRGAVWALMGQPTRATEAFEAALPAFKEAGDSEMIMSTLRGLGNQRLAVGDLRQAKSDLESALAMAVSRQEEPIVSGIKHNLGLLASYQGDIPEALELLVDSDQIYMRLTGSSAPQHVARCEVLLSVGLFNEAHRLAKEVAERHRASGDPEHLADALLVAAQGALLAGDLEEALATGEEAARVYAERQRPGHAVGARRIVIEARYGVEGASDSLLEQATEVVLALEAEQQRLAATQARLLAGRIAIDLGDIDQARRWLEPVSKITSGPVEHRIQGRLALAKLRRLHGDRRGADAAARAGLGLIDDYQSALGATDLRMGIERHGADLGSIGFDLALDSGEPRRILRWMERSRARSLRHRPVVAEKDDEIREALGRLRQIDAELRESRGDTQLERERQRLQERVRTADRLKRAGTRSDQTFDLDALIDGLGDRSLLEIAVHDGRLVGVMVSGGRARRAELGESATAMRELAHVRFRMRRVARRGRATGTWSLEPLDRMLLGDIDLDVDEVVLVPPPPLMTTPWAALPRLRDKTLTIAPSAEIWWRSELRASPGEGVVIAGGPDLDTARTEVTEIARLHESAKVFPPGSTVDQVKDAIDGVSLAHIACHATFQSENPMFSSLRLGDGDLNVYDIERLKAPPSTVVLSACDSGYTEAREGVELAGLTSALLSMGSRSVVASVGLVPDAAATADLMIDFHRGLIEGLGPAQALSRAQSAAFEDPERFVAAASFICVGA